MASSKEMRPTNAELEILQVLWQVEAATVREVNETLNAATEKPIKYTTTLKLMQIMTEKRLVQRNTDSRTHIYQALVKEEDIQQRLLDRFMDMTFRGSASKMVMQALGSNDVSKEELQAVKDLIARIEREKK